MEPEPGTTRDVLGYLHLRSPWPRRPRPGGLSLGPSLAGRPRATSFSSLLPCYKSNQIKASQPNKPFHRCHRWPINRVFGPGGRSNGRRTKNVMNMLSIRGRVAEPARRWPGLAAAWPPLGRRWAMPGAAQVGWVEGQVRDRLCCRGRGPRRGGAGQPGRGSRERRGGIAAACVHGAEGTS